MTHNKKEMLSFFLTTKCNLRCTYCYTEKEKHVDQSVDFEFAKVAIDEYFQLNKRKHIRFFGAGEPTTDFELMVNITEYARDVAAKIGKPVTIEIQTNGIFDSKEIMDWVANNIDIIWVSCDGTPSIQDKYRIDKNGNPTSKRLEANVKYLIKNCKKMIGFRTTITNENIYKQIEILDYFYSLGIRHVWADPIFPVVGKVQEFEYIDIMTFAQEFVLAYKHAKSKNMFYGSILTCNFDGLTQHHCRACNPEPHLTTDGYISACDMALYGTVKNHMSDFYYGKWNPEEKKIIYYEDKIRKLQSRTVDNIPKCRECSVKLHCGGYCLGEVVNETGDMFKNKDIVCEPIRYLYKHIGCIDKSFPYMHP